LSLHRGTHALALAALFALSEPALAHDFWIEPSTFRPAVGSTVALRLVVGQGFRGDALPRNPALIARFVLVGEAGETPVGGRPADEPAGSVRVDRPGLHVAGYRSGTSQVMLEPAKFEEYLREEGLEGIVAERARRGESQKPSREIFSRCAKALLEAGDAAPGDGDRPLGFTLELTAEKNPYGLAAGAELPVRISYEGKPLPDALVIALPYDEPDRKLSQRSDGKGRVVFRLPRAGVWLVKAVHMVRTRGNAEAEWESFWASMTFEIPAAAPAK
jgi:uncharacterized GH25 family protein